MLVLCVCLCVHVFLVLCVCDLGVCYAGTARCCSTYVSSGQRFIRDSKATHAHTSGWVASVCVQTRFASGGFHSLVLTVKFIGSYMCVRVYACACWCVCCECVYMCVCVVACVYMCVCVVACACMCVWICVIARACVCVCVCMFVVSCTWVCVCGCMCVVRACVSSCA